MWLFLQPLGHGPAASLRCESSCALSRSQGGARFLAGNGCGCSYEFGELMGVILAAWPCDKQSRRERGY